MKLHVCIDARLRAASGIGTLLRSVLDILRQERSIKLTLLCKKGDEEELKSYGAHSVVMKSPFYSMQEQLELSLKIPVCSLFWSFHFNIPLLPIRAEKRMVTLCDVYHLAHLSSLTLHQKIYAKLFINAAISKAHLLTTLSQFSKKQILTHAKHPPQTIEVAPPPFDFEPISGKNRGSYLLAVGNIKPHKNLSRLVQAYAQLKPKIPLLLAGKIEGLRGGDKKLLYMIDQDPFLKNSVHLLGEVDDRTLKQLYAEALLLIFPSIYEGFGYPPLEAMASGCPVVVSHAASIPEVCRDAAEYVDPFCIDSIARGIKRLLEDQARREELVRKGFQLVEEKRRQKNRYLELVYACCCHT